MNPGIYFKKIWFDDDVVKNINEDYYYTCGVSMPVYAIHMDRHSGRYNPIAHHPFLILSLRNNAYEIRRRDLETGIEERIVALL